jgi:hypothetical protein
VRASKTWNLLPKSVNTIKELTSFRAALGMFLEKIPDKPPLLDIQPNAGIPF